MSKSYGNTIDIFAEGAELKKPVMRIVTDSTPVEAPKDPEKDNVFALYTLFATPRERDALASRYRAGGPRVRRREKNACRPKIDETFCRRADAAKAAREGARASRRALRAGAERANAVANETMRRGAGGRRTALRVRRRWRASRHTVIIRHPW